MDYHILLEFKGENPVKNKAREPLPASKYLRVMNESAKIQTSGAKTYQPSTARCLRATSATSVRPASGRSTRTTPMATVSPVNEGEAVNRQEKKALLAWVGRALRVRETGEHTLEVPMYDHELKWIRDTLKAQLKKKAKGRRYQVLFQSWTDGWVACSGPGYSTKKAAEQYAAGLVQTGYKAKVVEVKGKKK